MAGVAIHASVASAVFDEGGTQRQVVRSVSISDIKDAPTLAALFEVDSNYGRWPEEVTTKDGCFLVGGREIPYVDSTKALPDWKAVGVDQ